jgi:hypothetical protein
MKKMIVEEMKGYIQSEIAKKGFGDNQIEIDFSDLAEESEIRQAAKELGYEIEPGEGGGMYWVYIAE